MNLEVHAEVKQEETALIKNYEEDYGKLLKRTENLRNQAQDRKILENIHYDRLKHTGTFSFFSVILIIFGIVIAVIVVKKLIPIGNMVLSVSNTLADLAVAMVRTPHTAIESNQSSNITETNNPSTNTEQF